MKPKRQSKKGNISQDLQTCFIIAGYTGAGKSTIVRTSHELEIRLFGEEFHQQFRDTSRLSSHEENDNYNEAIKIGANFQGKHLHNLKQEEHPPKILLIQLDLKHVVHKLGHKAASKHAKIKIEKLTDIPTPHHKKSDPKICNLMMANYLLNPFFQRFKKIIVNTVHTPFKANYTQFSTRKGRQGSKKNFSKQSKIEQEANIHKAMYTAWENNLHLLNPEQQFITTVNSNGDLMSNGQCICTNWKHKVGLT